MNLLRLFFVGMLISFLGTLPLGTLNVAALHISITNGILPAFYFAIGALLIEVLYVRISLVAMALFTKNKTAVKWIERTSIVVLLFMAGFCIYQAINYSNFNAKPIAYTLPTFLLGVLLSAVNPVQIPFWFGWSSFLYTKQILQPKNLYFNIYIAGIGLGTLIGNSVFIFGGKAMEKYFNKNQFLVYITIGLVFLITAIIYMRKLWLKRVTQ